MFFDRFDIVSAWHLALTHCHGGQWSREYARLCKITGYYSAGSGWMTYDHLSENARVIYDNACAKLLAH